MMLNVNEDEERSSSTTSTSENTDIVNLFDCDNAQLQASDTSMCTESETSTSQIPSWFDKLQAQEENFFVKRVESSWF